MPALSRRIRHNATVAAELKAWPSQNAGRGIGTVCWINIRYTLIVGSNVWREQEWAV